MPTDDTNVHQRNFVPVYTARITLYLYKYASPVSATHLLIHVCGMYACLVRVRACVRARACVRFLFAFFRSFFGGGRVLPHHQPSPAARNACGAQDAEQVAWEHAQALTTAQRKSRARDVVAKERQEVSEPAAREWN